VNRSALEGHSAQARGGLTSVRRDVGVFLGAVVGVAQLRAAGLTHLTSGDSYGRQCFHLFLREMQTER
jgi:hypothetical protein